MGHGHDHGHQRDLPPGMIEQLELAYAGVVSFGNRPFLTEVEQLESWRPDVAIVGAPFDVGTTNRPGARFGPRAIRATAYEPGTYHLDLGLEIFDWLEVVDFGDAYCPHGQTEVSHNNIRERVHALASRGIVPVILGGDHSITWPAATAVADVHGYGNVGIVHFDAHADTADEIEGNLASHGTPMRRLIESGAVPGSHFVQVGLRGYWPPQDTFEWMQEQRMTWHTMQEIWDRGFKEVMRDAVNEALAKAEKLYVSVDIDVLDPAHAPGTGTPEPGGITTADLLRLVRQLCREHDVVGVDVVEVAPAYDHAELTVNAAHRVVFEALGGMAARRRDAAPDAAPPEATRPVVHGELGEEDNEGMSGTLFFDGKCGMCTRSRNFLLKLNRTGELHTEPLQTPGTSERLGISDSALMDAVRWLDANGNVYAGAEAANAAVSAALGSRIPLMIYRVPGIRSLEDAVYRWVADHRYRFPGTTPYCESHPVSC